MTIESPRLLLGILVLIPALIIQMRAFVLGRAEVLVLGAQWAPDDVMRLFAVKWFFASLAFNIFLVFAVLAAADVTWGERPVEEDRIGLDIVVAVDVSRSMLAADVPPSRLVRSLGVVRSVSRQLPGSRIALVAFKGDAITLMPLTGDVNALEVVLDGAGPALISAPATNIQAGLTEALRAFPEATFAHRAVVLLSDGEALTGDADEPVAELRRRGVPVLAVMAGTPEGAPVPGGDGTAILDDAGRPVVSRANGALLADVAERTEGALLRLDDADVVGELTDRLASFVDLRETEGFRRVPRRRYRLFLGAALLALVVSIGVRGVKWRGMF